VNRNTFSLLFSLLALSLCAFGGVDMTFDGVNGAADFGYYVGPYYGTMNGAPVTLYCVDFANEVYWGESWQANVTSLESGDLSNTRYGGAVDLPNAQTLYEEAAWLTTQYASHPGDYGDIQATIWNLFDPGAPQPGSAYWAMMAAANYQTVNLSQFEIVTNIGPVLATGQVQEFLVDPPPIPEPSAIILLATALLPIAWKWRRYS
jgi:hypothetical protein